MGGRPLEGPTMGGRTSDWKEELGRFLEPFLVRLGHKARRQMCPLYVSGLIGPGDRKSVQPMTERLALGDYDQLHHFVAAGVWDATPLENELLIQADRLIRSDDVDHHELHLISRERWCRQRSRDLLGHLGTC